MGVDEVEGKIDSCQVEIKEITVTDTHITFEVPRADFSPYVLVWETTTGGGDKPGGGANPGSPLDPSGDPSDPVNSEDSSEPPVSTPSNPSEPESSIPATPGEPAVSTPSAPVEPTDSIPKTGDDTRLPIWLGVAAGSLLALCTLLVRRRMQRRNSGE